MNTFNLRQLIAQVAKEKGITQEKLHEALENAMLKAAKKVFGLNKAIEAIFDEERGEVTLSHVIRIVGDEDEDWDDEEVGNSEYLIRREERDAEIERLTLFYEENQLHLDTARNEYALDLNVGQFIRLPILYQAELISRQISATKAEIRGKKGPEREELNAHLHALQVRLQEESLQAQRYTERFGDLLLLDSRNRGFGRIAAQAAKLVIQEKVRQAERDKIFEDFNGREEIETGEIRRFERGGDIIVALTTPDQEQQVEALLPRREQIPHESYRLGKQVRCVIKSVSKEAKGAQILLSQRHPNFVKKLFEQNVPEIYHGIVEIRDVARIFGETRGVKVSVYSKDPNVDPAGACIGPNGSRVKLVEAEIGHDKIEIVPFSSESHIYVCNALQPAEVSRLLIDNDARKMDVIVPDQQLSKAIGRKGKNVRLASMLTGWSLDIYAEGKMLERERQARDLLLRHEGITPEAFDKMMSVKKQGSDLEQIAEFEPNDFQSIPGLKIDEVELIINTAKDLLDQRDAGEDPEHRDQERDQAWARWPKGDEVLTQDLFNRCLNIGLANLDTLILVGAAELSTRLEIQLDRAERMIEAAQNHLRRS